MVLPISPDVLHGVKLRSIGRQVLNADGAGLLGHKVFNQPATVRFGAVPNHQKLLFDVTLKMGEKLNNLGASDTARMELKVEVPPGYPGNRRKLFPVKRILQHRSLSFWRPCPATVRPLAEPTLVNKHYRAHLALGFFLSSGSLNRDLRPARPACLSPSRPCSSIALAQRLTDWRCAPTCRAISASLTPLLNKAKALNRRRSKASKSLFTPAGFPMQVYLSQILRNVTIFYEYQ